MGVPLFMETSGYIWYINGVQFSILPGDAGANLLLTHSGDASSTENWALALWRIWALSMGILLYWNCHCGTMPLEFPSPVHFGAPFREYVFFFSMEYIKWGYLTLHSDPLSDGDVSY